MSLPIRVAADGLVRGAAGRDHRRARHVRGPAASAPTCRRRSTATCAAAGSPSRATTPTRASRTSATPAGMLLPRGARRPGARLRRPAAGQLAAIRTSTAEAIAPARRARRRAGRRDAARDALARAGRRALPGARRAGRAPRPAPRARASPSRWSEVDDSVQRVLVLLLLAVPAALAATAFGGWWLARKALAAGRPDDLEGRGDRHRPPRTSASPCRARPTRSATSR